MDKNQELYTKAKQYIAGGVQLLSKRPELHLPEYWPTYFLNAKGCTVEDLNGKKYRDFTYMGIGACTLGYSFREVDEAVKKVIDSGSMSTLNPPEEVELAEVLLNLHPWASSTRFCRSGGEAMAIAVRIARASTKKDKILFCGYHGWHDWYLSANLSEDSALDGHLLPGLAPLGVPRNLAGTSFPFNYNNCEEFLHLIKKHKNEIGVVILETIRNFEPNAEFFKTIRETTQKEGIVLICDEISSGWRLNLGGAHLLYNIEPDIAVFAKAMSNGYPMAAVIGKKEIMNASQDTFISSTYWTERIGPTAALATISAMKKVNLSDYLTKVGKMVQNGWKEKAKKNNLSIKVSGIYPLGHFEFDYKNPLVIKTVFTQEMLKKGFMATTAYYASFGHTINDVEEYLEATDEVFNLIQNAIKRGNIEQVLEGPVCQTGFRRLT